MEKGPILLTLQCIVEGGTKNNLTSVITQSLMQQGGLTREEVEEAHLLWCRWSFSFSRMLRWNDTSTKGKEFSLHDGATLYGQ